MRTATVISLSVVLLVAFLAYVTWYYVFDSVDRVFFLSLVGYGSVSGQ